MQFPEDMMEELDADLMIINVSRSALVTQTALTFAVSVV